MRLRLVGSVFALALALMFASLLYSRHVVQPSYEAIDFGWPFPWLYYYVFGVMPVNMWFPNFSGIIIDALIYLAISFGAVSLAWRGLHGLLGRSHE